MGLIFSESLASFALRVGGDEVRVLSRATRAISSGCVISDTRGLWRSDRRCSSGASGARASGDNRELGSETEVVEGISDSGLVVGFKPFGDSPLGAFVMEFGDEVGEDCVDGPRRTTGGHVEERGGGGGDVALKQDERGLRGVGVRARDEGSGGGFHELGQVLSSSEGRSSLMS